MHLYINLANSGTRNEWKRMAMQLRPGEMEKMAGIRSRIACLLTEICEIFFSLHCARRSAYPVHLKFFGWVAEWSNAHAWKVCEA